MKGEEAEEKKWYLKRKDIERTLSDSIIEVERRSRV